MRRVVAAGLLLAALAMLMLTYAAAAEVVTLSIKPLGSNARIIWLPCNGTLTPFYQVVYAVPPGFSVRVVGVEARYAPGAAARFGPSAFVAPLLPNAAPFGAECRALIVQKGVWRGVTLVTILAAGYTSGGRRLTGLLVKLDVRRVGVKPRPLDPWTYHVVEELATSSYPVGWSVEKGPYRVGIIVLTRDSLLPAVGEWVVLKEMEGYVVKVVTVDQICREYKAIVESQGLRAAIRYAIEQIYRSAPDVYRYLVIVGDDSGRLWNVHITSCSMLQPWEVPTAYFYNPASSYDLVYSHSGYFVPSDIYYVTFDGNWDANGNGVLGEYPQDVKAYDPYPELLPVRIPVRDVRTAREVLEKLALNTPTGDYMVLAGSILYYRGEVNETVESQGDTLLEALYQTSLARDTWLKTVKLYEHYPASSSITSPSMINGNLTFTNLMVTLQGMHGIVTIVAHGTVDCVWRKIWVNDTNGNGVPDKSEIVYKPLLCAANAAGLQPQLLYTVAACLTAYYDNPNGVSLGEALLRHGSGYLGWNRITFAPLLPPEEEQNPEYWCCTLRLIYYLYNALLQPQSVERLGDALLKAIVEYVTAEPLDQPGILGNVSRRVFFALTAMFDPTRLAYSYTTSFDPSHLVVPAKPGVPVTVRLRLYAVDTGLPIANQPVSVYVYRGGFNVSKNPLLTVYTDRNGVAQFTVTAGVGGLRLLVYYPGSSEPPSPYEPITATVVLNTSLAPWVTVSPSAASTLEWIRVRGCGFPAYAPLDVLVEGIRVTRIYSNSSGCFDTLIALPYTLPLGPANLTVVDARYPGVKASTRIVVASNLAVEESEAVKRLSATLSSILDVLREIYSRLRMLQADVERLGRNVTLNSSRVAAALSRINNGLEKLTLDFRSLERKLDAIKAGLGRIADTGSGIAEMIREEQLLVEKVERDTHRILDEISSLQMSVTSLQGLQARIERLREELYRLNSSLGSMLAVLESRISTVESRLGSIRGSIIAVEKRLTLLEEALRGVNNSISSLRVSVYDQLGAINSTVSFIAEKVKRLEDGLATIQASVSSLQGSLTRLSGNVEMLASRINGNTGKLVSEARISTVLALAAIVAAAAAFISRRA